MWDPRSHSRSVQQERSPAPTPPAPPNSAVKRKGCSRRHGGASVDRKEGRMGICSSINPVIVCLAVFLRKLSSSERLSLPSAESFRGVASCRLRRAYARLAALVRGIWGARTRSRPPGPMCAAECGTVRLGSYRAWSFSFVGVKKVYRHVHLQTPLPFLVKQGGTGALVLSAPRSPKKRGRMD